MTKLSDLFRRPAGLADGLARKEPAPHVALDVTRPTTAYLGPPPPGLLAQRFGLARHLIAWCRHMSSRRLKRTSLTPLQRNPAQQSSASLAFPACFEAYCSFSFSSLCSPAVVAAATTTPAAARSRAGPCWARAATSSR